MTNLVKMKFKAAPALCLLLSLCVCGCGESPLSADDLDDARAAAQLGDWTGAERSLQRFLRQNHDHERRFAAWNLLLEINSRLGGDTRSNIEYLEAMRLENAEDETRLAFILKRLGEQYENMRMFDRAIEVWNDYSDLSTISESESVQALRRLAGLHFKKRSFEAGEEVLQSCLALSAPYELTAWCVYDLADAYMAREQWAAASSLAQQVLDSPAEENLRGLAAFLLGDAYEQQNKPAEALAQFEAAKGRYPNELVVDNRIAYLKKKLKK